MSGLSEELLYCDCCMNQINVYIDWRCENGHSLCPECLAMFLKENRLLEDFVQDQYKKGASGYTDEEIPSLEELLLEMNEDEDEEGYEMFLENIKDEHCFAENVSLNHCPICNYKVLADTFAIERFDTTYDISLSYYKEEIKKRFATFLEMENYFLKNGAELESYHEKTHDFLYECTVCEKDKFGELLFRDVYEFDDGYQCEKGHTTCAECFNTTGQTCQVCNMNIIPDYIAYQYFLVTTGKSHEDVLEDIRKKEKA